MSRCLVFLLFASTTSAGCGAASTPIQVTGAVTLDGKPLDEANLDFSLDDGKAPTRVTLKDGRFETSLPPGKYQVKINAYRPSTKPIYTPPGMKVDPREQYLPERYNSQTELRAEVTRNGPNSFEFPLQSQP